MIALKPWSFVIAACLLTACGADEVSGHAIIGDAIPVSLTGAPGDADQGREVFAQRSQGHCVICHQVSGLDADFQGNVGPALTGVGDRLDEGQLRLRIADMSYVAPDTMMPSYYSTEDLHQVAAAYHDETILSAAQIEDLVAYLATLKTDDGT